MCTGGFLGNKRSSREARGTPSAKVKNEWSYTSTPAHAFTECCAMNKGILTFNQDSIFKQDY